MRDILYKRLKVKKNATKEQITKAYRKIAFELHPDRNPGDEEAANRFKEATLAFEVLTDENRRTRYDETGEYDKPVANNTLVENLAHFLMQAIQPDPILFERDIDPEKHNIALRIVAKLEAQRKLKKEEKQVISGLIAKLEKARGRFEVSEGEENYLDSIARAHTDQLRRQLVTCDKHLVELDECLEYMKKVRYKTARGGAESPVVVAFRMLSRNACGEIPIPEKK